MAGEENDIHLKLNEPDLLGEFAALENIDLLRKGVVESIEPHPDIDGDSNENIFDFESEDLKIEFDFSVFNKW